MTAWKKSSTDTYISLKVAAAELALHYMTVYRYVRTGRLAAVKIDGEWRVRQSELANLSKPGEHESSRRSERYATAFAARLLAGDEPGSWQIVETALVAGADPEEIHCELVVPALISIGKQWAAGDLEVLDEHHATAVATRITARLGPMFIKRGRSRGTFIVGGISGDTHSLPTSILADLLRGRRFKVIDLGGNTPIESFAEVAKPTDGILAIGIHCSISDHDETLTVATKTLQDELPGVPVFLGGPGVISQDHAHKLGADGWAYKSKDVIELFESTVQSKQTSQPFTGNPA